MSTHMLPGFEDWLLARGLSPATVTQRLRFHASRLAEWGTLDVPPATITRWLDCHEGWTRRTYHNHLTSIYEWQVEAGARATNPMRRIKATPMPRPRPNPLSEDDLRDALAAAVSRTRAFLLLGYLAGLRACEIAPFRGESITPAGIYVFGKGGQGDMVPTHPLLWDLAQTYPREGHWFPTAKGAGLHITPGTVTYRVGELFRSLGIAGATHRARHTYGTHLLRGGANLRVVQELMRHRSLATTALYLGVDQAEKATAIGRLVA